MSWGLACAWHLNVREWAAHDELVHFSQVSLIRVSSMFHPWLKLFLCLERT